MPTDLTAGQHKRLTTICMGLAASLPIFVGVAFLRADEPPIGTGDATLLPEILALVGIALVLGAALVKRFGPPVPATLIAFSMRQTTGVLGFVVTSLTGDLVWCVALCIVALLAMLVDWPRRAL